MQKFFVSKERSVKLKSASVSKTNALFLLKNRKLLIRRQHFIDDKDKTYPFVLVSIGRRNRMQAAKLFLQ